MSQEASHTWRSLGILKGLMALAYNAGTEYSFKGEQLSWPEKPLTFFFWLFKPTVYNKTGFFWEPGKTMMGVTKQNERWFPNKLVLEAETSYKGHPKKILKQGCGCWGILTPSPQPDRKNEIPVILGGNIKDQTKKETSRRNVREPSGVRDLKKEKKPHYLMLWLCNFQLCSLSFSYVIFLRSYASSHTV